MIHHNCYLRDIYPPSELFSNQFHTCGVIIPYGAICHTVFNHMKHARPNEKSDNCNHIKIQGWNSDIQLQWVSLSGNHVCLCLQFNVLTWTQHKHTNTHHSTHNTYFYDVDQFDVKHKMRYVGMNKLLLWGVITYPYLRYLFLDIAGFQPVMRIMNFTWMSAWSSRWIFSLVASDSETLWRSWRFLFGILLHA